MNTNVILLTGRLTQDPEMKYTQTGKAVANFSLAVNPTTKDGEVDFFNCTAWEKTAEVVGEHLRKGSKVLVRGKMRSNKYQDNNGNNRISWKVQLDAFGGLEFLDTKNQNQGGYQQQQGQNQPPQGQPQGQQQGGYQQQPQGQPPQQQYQQQGGYQQ